MIKPTGLRSMPESRLSQSLSGFSENLFNLPDKLDDQFIKLLKEQPGKPHTGFRKVINSMLIKPVRRVAVDMSKFDSCLFNERLKIAEFPRGVYLILFYPVLIGARAVRGYQRGKKDHDLREVGDVLRRDLTCLTAFVFMLGPLTTKLIQGIERWKHIKLTYQHRERPIPLQYSQLSERYRIDNPEVLAYLCHKENRTALQKASKNYLDNHAYAPEIREKIREFNGILNQELIPSVDRGDQTQTKAISEKAYKILESLDGQRDAALTPWQKYNPARFVIETAENPSFRDFFADYAKAQRLPADITAFGLTCFAIGLFPVWFNGWWNRWEFQRQEEKAKKFTPHPHPYGS